MIKARAANPRDNDICQVEKWTLPLLSHYDPWRTRRRRNHQGAATHEHCRRPHHCRSNPKAWWSPRREPNQKSKTNLRLISPPPHPPNLGKTQTGNRIGLGKPVDGIGTSRRQNKNPNPKLTDYVIVLKTPPPATTFHIREDSEKTRSKMGQITIGCDLWPTHRLHCIDPPH